MTKISSKRFAIEMQAALDALDAAMNAGDHNAYLAATQRIAVLRASR